MSAESLIARLAKLRADIGPDSVKTKTALIRIGSVLSAQMKINSPILHGRLRNSINYIVRKTADGAEVEVGSYGVPYAPVIEFGYKGIMQVRAYGVKEYQRKSGSRVRAHAVKSHNRRINRKAKPFIQPAIKKHTQFIIDQIRTIAEPK